MISLGSQIATPRGYVNDSACNSIEAVAAGLGELTYNGMAYNEKYGINQRFVAIITDAVLQEDAINASGTIGKYCSDCRKCLNVCPAKALPEHKKIEIRLDEAKFNYIPADTNRCDWSSKYALCGDDGFKYIGSKTDEYPPEQITEEALADALRKTDPVLKYRAVTAEKCIVDCPLAVSN